MKYKEILREKYVQDMVEYLEDMLITLKVHGIKQIQLSQVADELQDVGFDVDKTVLPELLDQTGMIDSTEDNTVKLKFKSKDEPDDEEGEDEDLEQRRISQNAMHAIKSKKKKKKKRTNRLSDALDD